MFRQKIAIRAKWLFALMIISPSYLEAANATAPSINDYGSLPALQLMTLSPSGKHIAFRNTKGDSDVVVIYSREMKKMEAAYDISAILPYKLSFLDDQRLVLTGSHYKKLPGYRRAFSLQTAFLLDKNNSKPQQLLTPGDVIYKGQTGSGRIIGINIEKNEVYMPAYVGKSNSDPTPKYSLLKVDLSSPKGPDIHERGSDHTKDYFMNLEGEVIVEVIYNRLKGQHSVIVHDEETEKVIFEELTPLPNYKFVALTPTLKSIIAIRKDPQTGHDSYYEMSLQDGTVHQTSFGKADADIESIITDLNRVAQGIKYTGFNPSYHMFDSELQSQIEHIIEQFPQQSVHVEGFNQTLGQVLIYVEGSNFSGDYFLFSKSREVVHLGSSRPNIPASAIHPVTPIHYQSRDGLKIPALLTVPRDKIQTLKDLPAIILPHGGPEAYDPIQFDWIAQAVANQGYLVLQPQYRGSSGFGVDFTYAGYGEWGKKIQDDITDGVHFLSKQNIIDPQRVCIVGSSYGGYAALVGGALTPELYQCIVSINGIGNLVKLLNTEEFNHGKDSINHNYWHNIITKNKLTDEQLENISPVNLSEKFQAPVLLIHGENDEIVRPRQTEEMYKSLKRAKKDVTLVELDNENHNLMSEAGRQKALQQTIEFINSHIDRD